MHTSKASKNIKSVSLRLDLPEKNLKGPPCRPFKADKRHLRTLRAPFHSIWALRPMDEREKGPSQKEKGAMTFASVNGL